jgi:hypothetical protein
MNESRATATAARRAGAGAARVIRVWRKLEPERRLAAIAAILLFLSLFLPWYQETVIATGSATKLQSASASLTGWGAFSFVEAAILLMAAGVLTLLYQRAEGRAFHIPGGDGSAIMVAGLWTCVLVVWRIFDKQGTSSHGQFATTSGIEWGIFVALVVAALLAYAGSRIRIAHMPEPPLPGEPVAPDGATDGATPRSSDAAPRRPRPLLETAPPRRARPVPVESERRHARPPVASDEAQTLPMGEPPSRAARALPVTPDEQLTIPLDGEE